MVLYPLICAARVINNDEIEFRAEIIDFFEIILLITSILSIRQFFWPGDNNHTPFHIFNILYIIVFYIIAITFLVRHKGYFEGFETLSDRDCIKKYRIRYLLHKV